MLAPAWRYRQFIASAIRSDIRSRFSNSQIAGLWLVIQPLVQVAIFATILTSVLASKLPGVESRYGYTIYLLAGVGAWSLFNETLSRCINVFVESAGLLKKISFPRICLPLIVVGGALLNYVVLLAATIVFLLLVGAFPGAAIVWLVPLVGLVLALAVGFGVLLGVMNVFMRDIGQVAAVVLNIWFWFTPIVYPIGIVPDRLEPWLKLNPMVGVIEGFHRVFLLGRAPDWTSLAPALVLSAFGLLLAFVVFKRAGPEMVDAL